MKAFKFFRELEECLEEDRTIPRLDDYDQIVLNRVRYATTPINGEQYHFAMGGEDKCVIITSVVHHDRFPVVNGDVTVYYQLYHINHTTPNRMEGRRFTVSQIELL